MLETRYLSTIFQDIGAIKIVIVIIFIEISSKLTKLINNNEATPTPKIHHLCADLLRLSKPKLGSWDPKVAEINMIPIPKSDLSTAKK